MYIYVSLYCYLFHFNAFFTENDTIPLAKQGLVNAKSWDR